MEEVEDPAERFVTGDSIEANPLVQMHIHSYWSKLLLLLCEMYNLWDFLDDWVDDSHRAGPHAPLRDHKEAVDRLNSNVSALFSVETFGHAVSLSLLRYCSPPEQIDLTQRASRHRYAPGNLRDPFGLLRFHWLSL